MSGLYAAWFYFLFDRELYFVLHSDFLREIYVFLSKVFFLIICFYALKKINIKNKETTVLCMLLPVFEMLVSTIYNDGDLRRVVMMVYPVMGMLALVMVQCTSKVSIAKFVQVLSNLYFWLVTINFIFLIIVPNFFINSASTSGDEFFLGIENQIGYPLVKGFLFCYLDSLFTHRNTKLYLYSIMHCVTIFLIFSGSNLIGYLCMLAMIIKTPIRKALTSISLGKVIIVFVALFCGLFIFELLVILLQSSWLEYIIVELLGKSLTLTDRTSIWAMVVNDFFNSPWLGYGVRDTVDLFLYNNLYFSAHNQYLQSLYESGICYFIALIPFVKLFSDRMDRSALHVRRAISAAFLATMIMALGEAPGMDKILMISILGIGVSGYFIPTPDMIKNKFRKI